MKQTNNTDNDPNKSLPRELRVCRAIQLLAEGKERNAVAAEIGVRPTTLAKWLESAEFQALLACMQEHGRLRDAYETLRGLTLDAVDVLRTRLASTDDRVAIQTAKDVLDRVGLKAGAYQEGHETVIRFEYDTPDGQPYTAPSWADRHPTTPGTVQGGGVRAAVRQDGDGQDHDA